MTPPHRLTVAEIARRIRARELSPVAVVEACLARIEQVEPALRAWVAVDAAGALEAARALEAEARAGTVRGPLHGVPVGVKDIFHVAGMVTTSGAGPFAHERPGGDAEAVARLRQAGAIILGKTATTEFAYADPADTRNPWNREHTPGGSSSGSAAAVAAQMISLALGSQTMGSTLRPAAYCGIVGLKATHRLISAAGVTPLAWSLDHVGIFARNVDDAALVLAILAAPAAGSRAPGAAPAGAEAPGLALRPPSLGIPRGLFVEKASLEIRQHLDAVAAAFAGAGARIEDVNLPASADEIHDAGQLIMRVEAATFHAARFAIDASAYRPRIRGLIEEGLKVPAVDYVRARHVRRRFQEEMAPIFEQ
ncbi:MAG: amidase, partial [Armatimonadetes bacterium]|nr:amidase [Armatimonadota bacterium]